MTERQTVDTQVGPRGTMELLSQREIEVLTLATQSPQHLDMLETFRRCALAVLNTGNDGDDAEELFETYDDFSIEVSRRTRGLKLVVKNAPRVAFVDGRMVEGVREHLFAVLRDVVYTATELRTPEVPVGIAEEESVASGDITDSVFQILRHARLLDPDQRPNLVVCWGGHSIAREEYEYTKEVGYHLGLRGLDICTGCGPGAMKGPMKGAAIGHAKQRSHGARYIGLTEPGIIAAESPNPMVNHLVILPDIEKRLEAFVRLGHGIIVFPGGVGTAEEVLYMLGILMDPANEDIELPLLFTGPAAAADYFSQLDDLIVTVLGEEARRFYTVIVDDARGVARRMARSVKKVRAQRRRTGDAFYYNWQLHIPSGHQLPFDASHENVRALRLTRDLPVHELAVNLRRVFSAIVGGNVKAEGVARIREFGKLEITGDKEITTALDRILRSFVAQGRMKLAGKTYEPCYRVVTD